MLEDKKQTTKKQTNKQNFRLTKKEYYIQQHCPSEMKEKSRHFQINKNRGRSSPLDFSQAKYKRESFKLNEMIVASNRKPCKILKLSGKSKYVKI